MLISNVSQSQTMQGELRKADGSRRAKSEEQQPAAKKSAADRADRSDRSDLSADGRKQRDVQGEIRVLAPMVKGLPDVRTDKVEEAKARVSSGYYNTESFAESLAAKIIDTVV
jgi:anti-sigma28 factor (negative regulator of flagellin synthesis)